MSAAVLTLLPVSIFDVGDAIEVFGTMTADTGDYATGGVQAVWDFSTAPDSSLAVYGFKKISAVHATRPPISGLIDLGDASHKAYFVPVAGSSLPKIIFTLATDGTQYGATALPSSIASPTVPHRFIFRYKKSV